MSNYITTAHIAHECVDAFQSLLTDSIEVMREGETGDLLVKKQLFEDVNVDNLELSFDDIRYLSINPSVAYLFNKIRDEYSQLKDKENIKIFFEPLRYPQNMDCAVVTLKNSVSVRIVRQYDVKSGYTFCRLDVLYGFVRAAK